MNLTYTLLTTTLLTTLAVTPAFAAPNGGNRNGAGNGTETCTTCIAGTVDTAEAATLTFMREEEKLARDIYHLAAERWELPLFTNIAASEQQHMDAIAGRLTQYSLPDPIQNDAAGVFTDPNLSQLYSELALRVDDSLLEALRVGALIEEIDIEDNQNAMDATDNLDLKNVYGHLLHGSRNHLRAFVRDIERQGVDYTAQHLDQAIVDVIVDSPTERGGNGGGKGGNGQRR